MGGFLLLVRNSTHPMLWHTFNQRSQAQSSLEDFASHLKPLQFYIALIQAYIQAFSGQHIEPSTDLSITPPGCAKISCLYLSAKICAAIHALFIFVRKDMCMQNYQHDNAVIFIFVKDKASLRLSVGFHGFHRVFHGIKYHQFW